MKNPLHTCLIVVISLQPLAVLGDSKNDCVVAGKVFQDAMQSETLKIAYGEHTDWRRIDYYMLPERTQERIESDVIQMRATAESVVADIKKDIPEWKRQGLDSLSMSREILMRGLSNLGEEYAIRCLKALQQDNATSNAEKKQKR